MAKGLSPRLVGFRRGHDVDTATWPGHAMLLAMLSPRRGSPSASVRWAERLRTPFESAVHCRAQCELPGLIVMVRRDVLREIRRLPFSTAECESGPVVEHRPGRLTLRYDAEGELGIVWTVLSFTMVLAARFTPDAACAPWMVEAYSRVCEVEDPIWLDELRTAAVSRGSMLAASARHFVTTWCAIDGVD
jgi:hypothetical protein